MIFDYLYAFITREETSLSISRSYWAKIAAECKAADYHKALIEENLKKQISVLDLTRRQ